MKKKIYISEQDGIFSKKVEQVGSNDCKQGGKKLQMVQRAACIIPRYDLSIFKNYLVRCIKKLIRKYFTPDLATNFDLMPCPNERIKLNLKRGCLNEIKCNS